jgi:putative addiction module CopG family antidote
MKNVSISLTDQHASEIEAQIASGDFASVSEVVRAALRDFLARPPGPSLDQINNDIAAYRSALESGEELMDVKSVKARIHAAVNR